MAKTIGAFIFPAVWQSWDTAEATRMLKSLQDFGVNAIATEAETYRNDIIDLAHSLGMKFVGGISCFSEHGHNNEPLKERPELWPIMEDGSRRPLMEWYIGVTPTIDDYQESRLDLVERIMRDHPIDSFCLDFIRWPLHWELELRPTAPEPMQSSFDPHTVQRFLEFAGLERPADADTPARQARWILSEHRDRWTDFKCAVITDFVARVRERMNAVRPDVQLGCYLVPAPDDERAYLVGQRVADLAPIVDYLAPMVYFPVLHRPPEWADQTIDDMARLAPGKVLPVVQVDSAEGAALGADWGPPVPVEHWRAVACAAVARDDTQGLAGFTGTALFADNRGQVLRECLDNA